MPQLAVSVVDVLKVLGLGAAGFLVVALVCAVVLVALQLVLPSTDAGAAEIDRLNPREEQAATGPEPGDVDTGGNA
jgi:hypothetical protein